MSFRLFVKMRWNGIPVVRRTVGGGTNPPKVQNRVGSVALLARPGTEMSLSVATMLMVSAGFAPGVITPFCTFSPPVKTGGRGAAWVNLVCVAWAGAHATRLSAASGTAIRLRNAHNDLLRMLSSYK